MNWVENMYGKDVWKYKDKNQFPQHEQAISLMYSLRPKCKCQPENI